MHEYIPENILHNFADLGIIIGVILGIIAASSFLISKRINENSRKKEQNNFKDDFINHIQEMPIADEYLMTYNKEKDELSP